MSVTCEKDVGGRRGLLYRHDRVYVGERVGKGRREPWPGILRGSWPGNGEAGVGGPT